MASRIFPISSEELNEDKKVINTIDADIVLSNLKEAKKDGKKMPEDLLNMFKEKSKDKSKDKDDVEDKIEDKEDKEDKIEDKEDSLKNLRDKIKKNKDEEEEYHDKDEKEHHDKDYKLIRRGKEPKMSNTRVRKIHFSNPDQIYAEAAEAAKSSGDEALYNAILAVRNERRVALGNHIIETAQKQEDIQQRLAQRNQYRMKIVAEAEKASEKPEQKVKTSNNTSSKDGFKKVSSMDNLQKNAFAQVATKLGFPQDYINSMIGELTEPENVKEIKTLMASELPDNTKRIAIAAIVKIAELDSENVNRLLRYWKEELGYQDTQWVDHLFKTKYDTGTPSEDKGPSSQFKD